MRKLFAIVALWTILFYAAGICADLAVLQENVIRLHVVGASDAEADQNVKLLVKDAVNSYLQNTLKDCTTIREAKETLNDQLPALEMIAQRVLLSHGFSDPVHISLEQECFPRRDYETFSLPAGVYESLRIRIGQAAGRNWWCVIFPSLCVPVSGEDLRDVTAGAGFSDELYLTLTGEDDYQIRFFLLDLLGQLQNFWFES